MPKNTHNGPKGIKSEPKTIHKGLKISTMIKNALTGPEKAKIWPKWYKNCQKNIYNGPKSVHSGLKISKVVQK